MYQATEPRPVRVGEVEASIERLQGRRVAEVRVTDVGPADGAVLLPRGAWLGAMNQRPCASPQVLDVAATSLDPPTHLPPRSSETIEVSLPPSIDALAHRGLTLDLAFGDGASGCARLPLTGSGDEILWRGVPGWGGSGHLAIEWPLASAGGIGAGLTGEMRFHHPLPFGGDWRLSFGLPFGWGGCRGDCPSLEWYFDGNDNIAGIFVHLGVTASVARAISVGRWLFLPTLGARTSLYALTATSDYDGDRSVIAAGPFISLGVLRAYRDSPPGFAPPPTWRRGVEVTLSALRAYDRSPEGIVWLLGVGWTFVDEE